MASPETMDCEAVKQDLLKCAENAYLTTDSVFGSMKLMAKVKNSAASPAVLPEKTAPDDRLRVAYDKFVASPKGTPEHERAGDELVDVLFTDAK